MKVILMAFVCCLVITPNLYPYQVDVPGDVDANRTNDQFDQSVEKARSAWNQGEKRESLYHSFKALEIATCNQNREGEVQALRMVGQVLLNLQMLDSSRFYLTRAMVVGGEIGYHRELMVASNLLGILNAYAGLYDDALRYNFKTLEVAREIGDFEFSGVALENIGLTYFKLGDFLRAVEYFTEALAAKDSTGEFYHLEDNLINLSLAYVYLDSLDRARSLVDSALQVCGRRECSASILGHANLSLGEVSFRQQDWDRAEHQFAVALEQAQLSGNERFQLNSLEMLAETLLRKGEYLKALEALSSAKEMLDRGTAFQADAIDIYRSLGSVNAKLGNYKTAYAYQNLADSLQPYFTSTKLANSIIKVEAELIERESMKKIETQEDLIRLGENEIASRERLNLVLMALIFLTLVLTFAVYRLYRERRDAACRLDELVRRRSHEIALEVESLEAYAGECQTKFSRLKIEVSHVLANVHQLARIGMIEPNELTMMKSLRELSTISTDALNRIQNLKGCQRARRTYQD